MYLFTGISILKVILQIFSAVFAICSAWYWYKSASIEISKDKIIITASPADGYISVDTKPINNLANQLKNQGKYNKTAAMNAFFSAIALTFYLLLSLV